MHGNEHGRCQDADCREEPWLRKYLAHDGRHLVAVLVSFIRDSRKWVDQGIAERQQAGRQDGKGYAIEIVSLEYQQRWQPFFTELLISQ